MDRRGFTLLELMLVIAVLLAMGALAWPTLLRQLDERRFESGRDLIEQHLLLARATAQAIGEPIEVSFLPAPPRLAARRLELDELAATGSEVDSLSGLVAEGWSLRELPSDLSLRVVPPEEAERDVFGDDEMPFDEPPFDDGGPTDDTPMRLVVYLPDGSALTGDQIEIRVANRTSRLTVDAWTGLPMFDRATANDPDAGDDADEEDDFGDSFDDADETADDRGTRPSRTDRP